VYLEFTQVHIVVQATDDEGEEDEGYGPARVLMEIDLEINTKRGESRLNLGEEGRQGDATHA
jgi:hypothetical protein